MKKKRIYLFGGDAVRYYMEHQPISPSKLKKELDNMGFDYQINYYDHTEEEHNAYIKALMDMKGWEEVALLK